MPFAWRPAPGQVALIEVPGGDECLTGVVVGGDAPEPVAAVDIDVEHAPVVVDLGASPKPPTADCEVIASFFAPDALYRLTATATPHNGGDKVIDLRVHAIERVQRRAATRARLNLHATLSNFDDPGALTSVVGETVDLGEGGCRVRTERPFPTGCDPTLTIAMPDGEPIVALAAILQAQVVPADDQYRLVFEYRLVFLDMDDADRLRLADLARHPAAAA